MIHLDEQEIIKLYRDGWSMQSLANRFNVSHSVIKLRLINNKIPLRNISEAVSGMLSVDKSIYSRTGRQRQYPLNDTFFDILTPDSAYVIGLLQADGSVNSKRMTITLKPRDEELLKVVMGKMGASRPLKIRKSPLGSGICLDISSRKLVTSLAKWGLHSPKTYTASTHSDLLLNRDYWRGVIDGDGTLCASSVGNKIMSLVGSENICHQFLSFCREFGYIGGANVNHHKNIFSIQIKNSEAIKIAKVLYDKASIYLPRKYEIYLRWI